MKLKCNMKLIQNRYNKQWLNQLSNRKQQHQLKPHNSFKFLAFSQKQSKIIEIMLSHINLFSVILMKQYSNCIYLTSFKISFSLNLGMVLMFTWALPYQEFLKINLMMKCNILQPRILIFLKISQVKYFLGKASPKYS